MTPTIHRDDDTARSWLQRLRSAVSSPAAYSLLWGFAIFTAAASAGYVCGYRDGARGR